MWAHFERAADYGLGQVQTLVRNTSVISADPRILARRLLLRTALLANPSLSMVLSGKASQPCTGSVLMAIGRSATTPAIWRS